MDEFMSVDYMKLSHEDCYEHYRSFHYFFVESAYDGTSNSDRDLMLIEINKLERYMDDVGITDNDEDD